MDKKVTHLLIQARTKVSNNDWGGEFRKKYPKFRAIKYFNEPDEIKLAGVIASHFLMHSI